MKDSCHRSNSPRFLDTTIILSVSIATEVQCRLSPSFPEEAIAPASDFLTPAINPAVPPFLPRLLVSFSSLFLPTEYSDAHRSLGPPSPSALTRRPVLSHFLSLPRITVSSTFSLRRFIEHTSGMRGLITLDRAGNLMAGEGATQETLVRTFVSVERPARASRMAFNLRSQGLGTGGASHQQDTCAERKRLDSRTHLGQ